MDPNPTVLLIPVPEADARFGATRRQHDPSGRDGMPAHVTVLTPFVPLERWGEAGLRRLQAALAGIPRFEARFRRAGRFGGSTLFLVPEPEALFRDIARRVARAFPEHPPYGGQFSEVLPHLTLVHGAPESVLDEVEAQVRAGTDVRTQVEALCLFARTPGGRWVERARAPLDGGPGA